MDKEKLLKWVDRVQKAQVAYGRYLDVKYKALETKEKMQPVVSSIKKGASIGAKIGRVANDEVLRSDVKWVYKKAQDKFWERLAKAINEKAKASEKKAKARNKARPEE